MIKGLSGLCMASLLIVRLPLIKVLVMGLIMGLLVLIMGLSVVLMGLSGLN